MVVALVLYWIVLAAFSVFLGWMVYLLAIETAMYRHADRHAREYRRIERIKAKAYRKMMKARA